MPLFWGHISQVALVGHLNVESRGGITELTGTELGHRLLDKPGVRLCPFVLTRISNSLNIAEPPFTTRSKSRTAVLCGRRKRKYENGLIRYWRKKEDEGK